MMNTNDADLIQRTLDGDQAAFTTLVNKYQKSVHALVWRKIGDFHIAEEITQDVFLKVYKSLSTLKRRGPFSGMALRNCDASLYRMAAQEAAADKIVGCDVYSRTRRNLLRAV